MRINAIDALHQYKQNFSLKNNRQTNPILKPTEADSIHFTSNLSKPIKRIFILVGPPGGGKGTQISKLVSHLHLPHVDTGAIIRRAMKENVQDRLIDASCINRGGLLPDSIVAEIIGTRLNAQDCNAGFILDGFPRNLGQCTELEKMLAAKFPNENVALRVIYLDTDMNSLLNRIVNRRSCSNPECGQIYNLETKLPKTPDHCDTCGATLTQRKDDTEETAKARFETYFKETKPVIDYFNQKGNLHVVKGDGTIEEVGDRILKITED